MEGKRLEVYYDFISEPSRAVVAFCKINKIPFEPKVMSVFNGDCMKPEFIELNPNH